MDATDRVRILAQCRETREHSHDLHRMGDALRARMEREQQLRRERWGIVPADPGPRPPASG